MNFDCRDDRSRYLNKWLGALLAALVTLLAPGARAQLPTVTGGDSGKPTAVEADQGIEWQQDNNVYVARGNVKVTRGQGTLYADTVYAYYRPKGQGGPRPPKREGADAGEGALEGEATEIYRMEANGNVRLATANDTVWGDHAVDDVDQGVIVVTGEHLKLQTPRDTVTARKSLEWYEGKQLAVARGDAVAVREGKEARGDILMATVEKGPQPPAASCPPAVPQRGTAKGKAKAPARPCDPPPAKAASDSETSHISRIDAQGNVLLTSAGQVAQGDAGVYNLETGIATLAGHVRVTRGQNALRGQYAVVDMNRNISRMLSAPPNSDFLGPNPPAVTGARAPVQGIVFPRQTLSGAAPGAAPGKAQP